jgi:hypothetical protein
MRMEWNTPKEIDIPGSVLFLGSGFSQPALNILNKNLPTGTGLRDEFAQLLSVDPNKYDLRTLADEVYERNDPSLYQILYKLYTVRTPVDHQSEILRLPWRRIYTTNYDDLVEFVFHQNKIKSPSFNYDDPKPNRLTVGSVIHLHGVIRNTNEYNVKQQLVLDENSYIRQHFEKSPWYEEFSRDLRFCSGCYFIGYSLSDYHIAALLMQNPVVCAKTYFVTNKNFDPIFAKRVTQFGSILAVGAEGFADLCRTLPAPEPASGPYALKAFRYLDPLKDKKTLSPPTALEVLNLVTYGAFNYQRCLSTLPEVGYVIPRQELAKEAASKLNDAQCLLVHSQLGNGKTIFLHILAHKLSEQGYQCFWCLSNPPTLQQDINLLKSFRKVAVFFDSYNTAIDLIEQFTDLSLDTKFIVAVRTGVQEIRLHEIQTKLPKPLQRVNLNIITKRDRDDFHILLDRSGVRTYDLEQKIEQCRDIRDIVVSLYDHKEIKNKMKSVLQPVLQDENVKNVFIVSHLLKWIGHDVDASFVRSITGRDAYAEMFKVREMSGDVFTLNDDNVQVISSIFSEYLIENHFAGHDITESIYSIIVEAVKRKAERRYQPIMSRLMQFSRLKRALRNDPDYLYSLKSLFDRLRRDIDVNQEPLFWLQYSILMVDANDLNAAESFLETAYSRAAASPGFLTYQIDTHALRLLMLIEERDRSASNVRRFDQIIEKMDLVQSMIGEESHRGYAIRVLEGIEPRVSVLSIAEKNVLVFQFSRLIDNLGRLSPDARAQTGSDEVVASIGRAKNRLLS